VQLLHHAPCLGILTGQRFQLAYLLLNALQLVLRLIDRFHRYRVPVSIPVSVGGAISIAWPLANSASASAPWKTETPARPLPDDSGQHPCSRRFAE